MIKKRQDCTFLFLTKRIDRFMKCIPNDWNDGYDNVVVCCTIENQKNVDYKLAVFKELPSIRKNVDFEFRQCGTYTIKDGKQYKIQTKDLCKQAKLANINYKKQ